MDYLGQNYLKQRIEKNQKFLLKLLNLHIGSYFPLRKYLGISYKGKIDEISHLSFAYNTKYFKKGRIQQTREYQQPDLGYKLNLVLDKIPQLVLLPALLQPAFRLASVLLFSLTTTTYQPSTKDAFLYSAVPNTNYGTLTRLCTASYTTNVIHFDTTDIPAGATFSQGDLLLYCYAAGNSATTYLRRLTQLGWTEAGVTWNKYDGTNAWATAGGDSTTTNQTSITLAGTGWHTWSSYALIQDCYDNQSKNVHLHIPANTDANGANHYSRDYTTDTSLRPKLTVTYTVPSGPANLKTYNTNAKANIKSINTNTIANCKSLNTNV